MTWGINRGRFEDVDPAPEEALLPWDGTEPLGADEMSDVGDLARLAFGRGLEISLPFPFLIAGSARAGSTISISRSSSGSAPAGPAEGST